jgi:hypothetical protein
MFETILDDQGTDFTTSGTWTNAVYDSGLWKAAGPFYHSWAGALHQTVSSGGEARWQLPIEADDTYTISAWWPAAPQASNWTSQATYEVVAGSTVRAATNLDQRATGDQWHPLATVQLSATNPAYVRLTASSGICVADALHLRSQSRFNNGQPAALVRLQPMDGIVLQREQPVLAQPGFGAVRVAQGELVMTATNLTPGYGYTLERTANLLATSWVPLQSFRTLGFSTNLADALSATPAAAYYRLRAE